MVKGTKHSSNLNKGTFTISIDQLSLEKPLLAICKILRLFLNTFIADDKYSLLNRDNLTSPIQTQLSRRQKCFPQFFAASSKSRLNFADFQKKR